MTLYHTFNYHAPEPQPKGYLDYFSTFDFARLYILCFSLIGAMLATCDVCRLVIHGPTLPIGLQRKRYKGGCMVSERLERDIKLVCTVLVVEFFILIIIGIVMDKKELMLPWLCMQTCMIVGELITFAFNVSEGIPIIVNGWVIICAVFAIFNWLQVFNELRKDNSPYLCGFSHICGHKM